MKYLDSALFVPNVLVSFRHFRAVESRVQQTNCNSFGLELFRQQHLVDDENDSDDDDERDNHTVMTSAIIETKAGR